MCSDPSGLEETPVIAVRRLRLYGWKKKPATMARMSEQVMEAVLSFDHVIR
jgi:hypothetical protein